jgi:hypothetical protein
VVSFFALLLVRKMDKHQTLLQSSVWWWEWIEAIHKDMCDESTCRTEHSHTQHLEQHLRFEILPKNVQTTQSFFSVLFYRSKCHKN